MKKNFSFLFALFLMFTGAMNVYADAYPFKITTDAENPELYAIKSGRGDAFWWTFDVNDGLISLSSYVYDDAQHWYFMEVTEGETTYLQLFPYLGEGKAMGYKDTAAGAAKVWAVAPGTEGYDCRWIFDNNGGNAPYGLKTSNGAIYLSHYGGGSNKMGFWTTGPAGDGGTAMYYEPVSKHAATLAAALKASSVYQLQKEYGLVQETSKFYCNVPQPNEGSLNNLLDDKYDTYFHSAWQASYGKAEKHYLQVEVSKPVESFNFYFKKRHNNNNNRPTDVTILGSADGNNYTEITNINSGFPTTEDKIDYMSETIVAPMACKFFRFVINATNNNALTSGYPFFTFSEFYMFPSDKITYLYDKFQAMQEAANKLLAADENNAYAFNAAVNAFEKAKADYADMEAFLNSDNLFTPVTNEATLAAGKQYIVVAAKSGMAMSRLNGEDLPTRYRLSTKVTMEKGLVETSCAVAEGDEAPYMVALESAGEGLWMLKDVVYGKYLLWEEKRSLDLTEDMSKASKFEITINEEGEAVIKLEGKDRTVRYGEEDGRFACYATGQEAVKLYEDATANEYFVAYAQLANIFNTSQSMWMIPAVSEKAMTVVEIADAINAAGAVTCSPKDLNAAVVAMTEFIAYANAMDAKYSEFKEALWACYDLQDNSTASVKVATVFAAVVDKYSAYQWSVPATTVAEFDTYIAELNVAARNYALKAVPAGDFTFDNIAIESEWNGTELEKSLTGHLYNPAAKAFLGTANSWGTQASFLENGYKWTVSSEAICDFEWLFDGAEDICAANVGGINLVPLKVVGKKQTPVAFEEGEDNGIVATEDGIYLPKTTALFLDLNEEADLKNYTLVYDIKLANVTGYTSLFQTDLENDDDDGEMFVAKGTLGINRNGLGYGGTMVADIWHKVVIVGDNGYVSTYIDGLHVRTSGSASNSWIINKEGLFFFLDNDGESTDVEVAGIQLWKKSLNKVQIAQMSGVKELIGEPIPARTAQWTFDDADNLFANEVGTITLAPRKTGDNNTAPTEFAEGEANGVEKSEEGIALDKMTCLFMDLDEAADLKNYTIVYDFKAADVTSNYISFLQTNLNNNEDGDLFMNKSSQFGINQANLGYKGKFVANTWYRLAAVVRDGFMNIFINGEHVGVSGSAHNIWTMSKDGVLFFIDNDGEHNSLELGGLQFWNQALSNDQIKAMGGAFAEDADVKVEVPVAAAPTYTVSGPLCHPSNVNQHYLSNGYGDGLAEAHTFTLVGKNTYAIQNSKGKYYGYKAGTTVVQLVDNVDESCYWQFVTEEEFRGEFAEATAVNPVNATFAIDGQGFGYNNTGVKMWTGEPNTGGDYTDYVAYKQNVENFDFSYVVRNMPSGVYRMKVQGFYRQGTPEAAVEARKNGTEINPAKFYANDASVTVMSIIEEAGKNTASTHGGMYGDYGKCPWSNNDAGVYFRLGLYEHELVFTLEEGVDTIKIGMAKNGGVADDWAVMDNFRLEYLGAKNDADYMGAGIVDAMTEGDKYVYYTDANGDHHFLTAAGQHNWVVVDEPTTIAFSTGKGTYAKSASHMTSNGFQMSNTVNGDGTGAIATSTDTREWESQVFYKNAAGKYAIRLTNVNATNWGAYKFVNVEAETLAVVAGEPSLGDALYIWTISEEAPEVSAIDEVEVSEVANRAYYTLGGVPVDAPVQGVNIEKITYTNGKVEIKKIYVK